MIGHFMKQASLCLSVVALTCSQGLANDSHEQHENMIKFDQFHEELASRSAEMLQEAKETREAFEKKRQEFVRTEIRRLHCSCTMTIAGDNAMYNEKWFEFYQTTEHPDYPGKIFLKGQQFSGKGDPIDPIL